MINSAINFLYEISGMKKHAYEQRKYEVYFDHISAYRNLSADKQDYFLFLQYAHERRLQFSASTVGDYIAQLDELKDYVTDDMMYSDNSAVGMYNGRD